jgi:hypothetical protein
MMAGGGLAGLAGRRVWLVGLALLVSARPHGPALEAERGGCRDGTPALHVRDVEANKQFGVAGAAPSDRQDRGDPVPDVFVVLTKAESSGGTAGPS